MTISPDTGFKARKAVTFWYYSSLLLVRNNPALYTRTALYPNQPIYIKLA